MVASPRVLIIDDDLMVLHVIQEILERAGITAITRDSGLGATNFIHQEKIDVVVADLNMPSLSGDRLVELLRGHPRTAHVGVVMVSGTTEAELAATAEAIGADAYVTKDELTRFLEPAVRRAYVLQNERTTRASTEGRVGS